MRKRLVIGAIAAVVIGVAAYVFSQLSQPREGTLEYLEYHKKKYVQNWEMGPVGEWINFHAPALRGLYWEPNWKRQEFHRNALLEAGYLARREVVLSNVQSFAFIMRLSKMRADLFTDLTNDPAGVPLFWLDPTNGNRIGIVARASDIDKWEDAIRKADVPEDK